MFSLALRFLQQGGAHDFNLAWGRESVGRDLLDFSPEFHKGVHTLNQLFSWGLASYGPRLAFSYLAGQIDRFLCIHTDT